MVFNPVQGAFWLCIILAAWLLAKVLPCPHLPVPQLTHFYAFEWRKKEVAFLSCPIFFFPPALLHPQGAPSLSSRTETHPWFLLAFSPASPAGMPGGCRPELQDFHAVEGPSSWRMPNKSGLTLILLGALLAVLSRYPFLLCMLVGWDVLLTGALLGAAGLHSLQSSTPRMLACSGAFSFDFTQSQGNLEVLTTQKPAVPRSPQAIWKCLQHKNLQSHAVPRPFGSAYNTKNCSPTAVPRPFGSAHNTKSRSPTQSQGNLEGLINQKTAVPRSPKGIWKGL